MVSAKLQHLFLNIFLQNNGYEMSVIYYCNLKEPFYILIDYKKMLWQSCIFQYQMILQKSILICFIYCFNILFGCSRNTHGREVCDIYLFPPNILMNV